MKVCARVCTCACVAACAIKSTADLHNVVMQLDKFVSYFCLVKLSTFQYNLQTFNYSQNQDYWYVGQVSVSPPIVFPQLNSKDN